MLPFVDTNVLVYAHDIDEPEKQATALALLDDIADRMTVSAQVLAEFYVVTTRKLARPLDAAVAAEQVDHLRQARVVATDADLVAEAIGSARRSRLSLWDALILRAAARGGCDVIFTEDLADGAVLDGVTIRNPFATTRPAAPA